MADEAQVVRGIDWRSTFPFTLIFRSFRIAVHPSKLVLALLAIVLIYGGGRMLDWVWQLTPQHRAVPGEMMLFEETRTDPAPSAAFNLARNERYTQAGQELKARLKAIGKPEGDMDDLRWAIKDRRDKAAAAAEEAYKKAPDAEKYEANLQRKSRISAAYASAESEWEEVQRLHGRGLFATIFEYELAQLNGLTHAVGTGNWMGRGGVSERALSMFVIGPWWALRHHYVYFTIFFIYLLVIWSIFGGAIARIAAVHVARDEKISIRQALAFSIAKFLSFLSAPLIPLVIILAVGIVVAAGGLLLNIPVLGPILVGALYFLALAAGFVMTLVLIGTVGGFNLMYPTIAVEGSDSFDAISRSFSYLYARPWRLAFYTLVALIYGTICYIFVRYFVYLLLAMTHYFTGWWVFYRADNTEPLWPMLWPGPMATQRLSYDVDYLSLSAGQATGAFLVAFWVYLTIAMLGAFLLSFYISANTVIYYLMRNEVDATELDDVYLEQTEEDFTETPVAESTTTSPVTTTTTTEVVEATPVNPPPSEPPPPASENPPST
jgi:hypothetical protein